MGYPDILHAVKEMMGCIRFNPLDGAWAIRTVLDETAGGCNYDVSIP